MPQSSFVTSLGFGELTMQNLISSLPILCYGVALALGFLGIKLPFASAELSPLTQWILFLSLGVLSLWSAFSHAVYTDRVARSIGWAPSPFQKEIAGANLGIGFGAVVASTLGVPAAWTMFFVGASFLWSGRRFISPTWCATRTSPSTIPGRSSGGTFSPRSRFSLRCY
jgi:hypothetical protein